MKSTNFKIGNIKTNDEKLAAVLEKIAGQVRNERMYFNQEGNEITRKEAMEMDDREESHFHYMKRENEIVYWQF